MPCAMTLVAMVRGVSPTITGDHENRVTNYTAVVCYSQTSFAQYAEQKPLLRASGGDLGGSEGLIVYESLSSQDRSAVRQQPSRVVYRPRRIQRHAAGDREESR